MPCLTVDRLYDYMDGVLSAGEKETVESHLRGCPVCRCALEVRRNLAGAAESLAPFEVPEDFADGVMAKIPAAKKPRLWLIVSSAAAAVTISGIGLFALLTGQGAVATLQKIGSAFGSYLQSAINFAAKGLKVLSMAGKVILTLSGQVLATFRSVADMVGPEAQVVLAGGTLVILITGGLLLRRRQILSERIHDK